MNTSSIIRQYKDVLRALSNSILLGKESAAAKQSCQLLWRKSPIYPILASKFRSEAQDESTPGDIQQLNRYICLLNSIGQSKELNEKFQSGKGTVEAVAARVGFKLPDQ